MKKVLIICFSIINIFAFVLTIYINKHMFLGIYKYNPAPFLVYALLCFTPNKNTFKRKFLSLTILFCFYSSIYFIFMPKYTYKMAISKIENDDYFNNKGYTIYINNTIPTMSQEPKPNWLISSGYCIKAEGEKNFDIAFNPVSGNYIIPK